MNNFDLFSAILSSEALTDSAINFSVFSRQQRLFWDVRVPANINKVCLNSYRTHLELKGLSLPQFTTTPFEKQIPLLERNEWADEALSRLEVKMRSLGLSVLLATLLLATVVEGKGGRGGGGRGGGGRSAGR